MPYRLIETGLWDDGAFCELQGVEARAVFLRLVTGSETTAAGASRVHPRRLAGDLDLELERARLALEQLVAAGLVRDYGDGWLWLPSFIRHQARGPDFVKAARRSVAGGPASLRRAVDRALEAHAGPSHNASRNGPGRLPGVDSQDASSTPTRRKRDKKGAPTQEESPPGGPPAVPPGEGPGTPPTREKVQVQDLRPFGPSRSDGTDDHARGARLEGGARSRDEFERVGVEGIAAALPEGPLRDAALGAAARVRWEGGERGGSVVALPRCEGCGWAVGPGGVCERCAEAAAGEVGADG